MPLTGPFLRAARVARWLSETSDVTALPVRELGLRGAEDDQIFFEARKKADVVITKDINCPDFALARRNTGAPIPRLFVLIASVLFLDVGILIMVASNIRLHPQSLEEWVYLAVGLPFSLLAFAGSLDCFRLRNRLGKVTEDWMGEADHGRNEIPPDKPVAS